MRVDRTRLGVLLLALTLLLVSLGPLAQAGSHDDQDEQGEDDDRRGPPGEDDDEGPPGDAGPPAGVPPAGAGHIQQSASGFSGNFIAFDLTSDGLANFTYGDAPVFDRVTVPGLVMDESRAHGARVDIEGEVDDDDVEFKLHDTPTSLIKIEIRGSAHLEIELAGNVTPSIDGRTVNVVGPEFKGVLWADEGRLTVNGSTIHADGRAEVKYMTARGPRSGDGQAADAAEEITQAASKGRVGAEVRAFRQGGQFRSEVAELSDVSVMASQSRDGVLMLVSSDNETGRTIVAHVDRSALPGNASGMEVRFDGEPIELADDLADVLDPSNDNGAEYVILEGQGGVQVLVSVPSFSTHTVEVAGLPGAEVLTQLSLTQIATALGAAAVTVALAATVAAKR